MLVSGLIQPSLLSLAKRGYVFTSVWEGLAWNRSMDLEFHPQKATPASRQVSWVEVFSLSAVGHGLLIGMVLIVWLGLNPERSSHSGTREKISGETICFWEEGSHQKPVEPNRKNPFQELKASNADLVPFTIQMSPIGLAERFAPTAEVGNANLNNFVIPESGGDGARTWFDCRQLPEKTAWLIDCSLSMGIHSHFTKAHRHLQFSLGQTSAQSKARLWAFAKYPREIAGTGDWSCWTPERRRLAASDLESTVPAGNTDLASALRVVLGTNPDLIQILTDEDHLSEKDLASLRRLQSRHAKPMPRMRVVVLTNPANETPLQVFCRQAGCSYQVITGSGNPR